jgi:hypothetical protein
MSIRTEPSPAQAHSGITRQEALAAVAEVAALFVVFIIAFTGRDTFSDGVKSLLTVLSVAIGAAGTVAGAIVIRRAVLSQPGRIGRAVLGGCMVFFGIYTIIHVLS